MLDLENWKIQLPVARPDGSTSPAEVKQPQLASASVPPWFEAAPTCDGVVFRAPVDGVTTKNSRNPRSELREMADGGSNNASWSSTAGSHSLTVTEAFVRLPAVKPHLVGVQIHDAEDDISTFRLEGRSLYVTNGDDPHYKLVTPDYVLGTRFDARFDVRGGTVEAYYNGVLQTAIPIRFSGGYFKAGAYTQANCDNSAPCSGDNYGQTEIYRISVAHNVTWRDELRAWLTSPVLTISVSIVLILVSAYLVLRVRRVRRR